MHDKEAKLIDNQSISACHEIFYALTCHSVASTPSTDAAPFFISSASFLRVRTWNSICNGNEKFMTEESYYMSKITT